MICHILSKLGVTSCLPTPVFHSVGSVESYVFGCIYVADDLFMLEKVKLMFEKALRHGLVP